MKHLLLFTLAALLLPFAANAQWNMQPGYRAFYDLGVNIGTGNASKTNFEISTAQGYQIVPTYFYIGTGAAFQSFFNADGACAFPVFLNMRSNFSPGKVSPFIDVRVGYVSFTNSNVYSDGGFYLNPSLGLRFAVNNNFGINIRAGYSLEYARVNMPRLDDFNGYYDYRVRKNVGAVNIQLGIDF